jgi:hypothetical protein
MPGAPKPTPAEAICGGQTSERKLKVAGSEICKLQLAIGNLHGNGFSPSCVSPLSLQDLLQRKPFPTTQQKQLATDLTDHLLRKIIGSQAPPH